jgi:hypothetical protein
MLAHEHTHEQLTLHSPCPAQVELRARRLLSELEVGARHIHSAEDAEKKSQEDAERLLVVSMVGPHSQ